MGKIFFGTFKLRKKSSFLKIPGECPIETENERLNIPQNSRDQ